MNWAPPKTKPAVIFSYNIYLFSQSPRRQAVPGEILRKKHLFWSRRVQLFKSNPQSPALFAYSNKASADRSFGFKARKCDTRHQVKHGETNWFRLCSVPTSAAKSQDQSCLWEHGIFGARTSQSKFFRGVTWLGNAYGYVGICCVALRRLKVNKNKPLLSRPCWTLSSIQKFSNQFKMVQRWRLDVKPVGFEIKIVTTQWPKKGVF